MVDIPNNNTTTATISVGQTVSNQLEVIGDHDWFLISLTAGQSISIALDGITLEDPYLRIRNASGQVIYENDDTKPGIDRDSLLAFTANYTGTYYIDVGAWDENYTGTYSLTVSPYTPPPVGTIDQIADQLVEGYYSGNDRHFNVTQGGTLTVNLTGLTASGVTLARQALQLWTDIIGVSFSEVTGSAQITFDDNESGAYSTSNVTNHIITSSFVNVSSQWLTNYGTSQTSYSFQTYIHEIGHALGLGHAGNYNETARFPFDANFLNDSWAVSIMSYFDQQENTYFASQGFQSQPILTPMMADIVAMSTLYGLSTTTRSGNTVYGVNTNAENSIFDVNAFQDVAFTVLDSGGIDTFDYSTTTYAQRINLNPETFSFVGNRLTVSIARGTIIENATGGSGDDIITGNSVNNVLRGGAGADTIDGGAGDDIIYSGSGNDILTGGAGADTFIGTIADHSSTNIWDFTNEDRLVFSDANISTFTYSLSGNALFFGGTGAIVFQGLDNANFVASAAVEGGVQLRLQPKIGSSADLADFNGDGRDDILWRHSDGTIMDWLGQTNGGFTNNYVNSAFLNSSWAIIDTGDFNGDGRDDILFRNGSGQVMDWLGQTNGSFFNNYANAAFLNSSWSALGVGDFNGDGKDDVLWRNADGTVMDWLGQTNGTLLNNYGNAAWLNSSWSAIGIADFNGDNRDDILWRNIDGKIMTWVGQADGSFVNNYGTASWLNASWSKIGTGDFNGDGRDDVLFRNSDGTLMSWLGQVNGSFYSNYGNAAFLNNSWQHLGTGDFNGDGIDDILFRNNNGLFMDWLGQVNGTFVNNYANAEYLDANWTATAIGDVNNDGRDDILWRHANGAVMDWLGEPYGGFANNYGNSAWLNNSWQFQSGDSLL